MLKLRSLKKLMGAGDLAASIICTVIGQKLSEDEDFQGEVMAAIDDRKD